LLQSAGVDSTDLKPLFAMEAWTGEAMILLEAGSPTKFYFYSPIDASLHEITGMYDLAQIVDWMGDEDKGYSSLPIEQIL
jgi:hypothetical protein